MSYELVYTPKNYKKLSAIIRDEKDFPVLYTAMIEDVDILITGDKDFEELDIEKPEILIPTQFQQIYVK